MTAKTDYTPFWRVPNAPVQFTIRGRMYSGIVLEWSDRSRRENDYDLCKVEVTETTTTKYKDWNNEWHRSTTTKTSIWPEPIQSYRLRKRLLKDEVTG